MVRLVYNDQTGRECFVEMNAQNSVLMIGRNPDCGIQTNNSSVSRVHAMLTFKDGKLFVQDPPNGRPTNGTKIDGMRLQPGEVLELFSTSKLVCGNFEIQIVSDGGGDAAVAQMGNQNANPSPYTPQGGENANAVAMNMGAQGAMRDPRYGGQGAASYPQNAYPQQGGYNPNANMNQPSPSSISPVVYDQMGQRGGYNNAQGPQRGGYDNQGPQRGGYDNQGAQRQSFDAQRSQYDVAPPPRSSAGKFDGRNARMGRMGNQPYHGGNQPNANPQNPSGTQPQSAPAQTSGAQFQAVQGGVPSDVARELEELRSAKAALEEELKHVRAELDTKKSEFAEQREVNEMTVAGYQETIGTLKDQLNHQTKLNASSKAELKEAQEQNANLQIELDTLKDSLESKGIASSNAETTIANLKVQLNTKSRQLNETLKELTKAQADVQEERDNAERLEDNVHELNASLENFQNRCRDMQKVIEMHENKVEDLHAQMDARGLEIKQLQDALKRSGSGDVAKFMNDAAQAKEQLSKKTAELNDAQKEIDSLKAELEKAASQSSASSNQGGADPETMNHLRDVAQSIGDSIGQWRSEFQNLESSINSLQRVFIPYVRLDVSALTGQDKVRVENMLKEYDPRAIFEEIGNALDACQNYMSELKGHSHELRDVLAE